MTIFQLSALTILLFNLCGTISFAQEEIGKKYQWKDFKLTYPAGWEIKLNKKIENKIVENVQMVEVTSIKGADQVSIIIGIMEGTPAKDIYHEKYEEMPVLSSLAYGLGQALKLAGDAGETAIAVSYRSLELSTGPSLSAVFTVMPTEEKGEKVYLLECFHQFSLDKKKVFMGTLITVTERGGANTRPTYAELIQEAYAIVRSAVFMTNGGIPYQ